MALPTSSELAARLGPGPCAAFRASLAHDHADDIAAALESALAVWSARAAGRPFKAVRISLVGDDIEPYVPSTAWAAGYGDYTYTNGVFRGRDVLFREEPAFEPSLLGELCHAAEATPALADDRDFELLKDCFVAKTWEDVSRAVHRLEPLLRSAPFEAVLLTLGHDAETRVLYRRG